MPRHAYNCARGCPVESTLQVIAGKWKSVIIYHLITNKSCRFSELQRLMPHISRRMLALQLKELAGDNVIAKTTYPVVPPRTSYELTDWGKTLTPLILEMEKWGEKYNQTHVNDD
ncbi:transcriptional regulator [Lactobacillus sp. XV13L]|nr:transcriptional regulator [Lactobacillus sp. XV13L]